MTLREKLDEKLKTSPTPMWKELEDIFLSIDPLDLEKGVKVSVFKNGNFSKICYKPSTTEGNVGTPFSSDYTIADLNTVIEIAKENGLQVTILDEGWHYEFSYFPTWA